MSHSPTAITRPFSLEILLAEDIDGYMPPTADFWRGPQLTTIAKLRAYPEYLRVDATSVDEALDIAYREANVGTYGWASRYRDNGQRSLSVGDVIIVNGRDSYQCLPQTWARLEDELEVDSRRAEMQRVETPSIDITELAAQLVGLGLQHTVLELPDHQIVIRYEDEGVDYSNVYELKAEVERLQHAVLEFLKLLTTK